jgi:hypothetical protein
MKIIIYFKNLDWKACEIKFIEKVSSAKRCFETRKNER